MKNCPIYENGFCLKFGKKNIPCKPSSKDWLDRDSADEYISTTQMCQKSSIFGNTYIGLTQSDVDRLKNGEIFYMSGEYGIFIGFIPE